GIDLTHVSLLPWSQETLLANIVYAMSPAAVRNVVVGGRKIVQEGQLETEDVQALSRNIQQLIRNWM
ncbi:MAG TPA: S-adenosylhomocysteine deaminase, partial [Sulfobacillus sp.]|nr:S-adenosylhomocysteine deaminase [Sulfobacillus sp.]